MVFGFSFGSSKSKNTIDQTQTSNENYAKNAVTPEWWKTGLQGTNLNFGDFSAPYLQPGGYMSPDQQTASNTLYALNTNSPGVAAANQGQGWLKYVNTDLIGDATKGNATTAAQVGDVADVNAKTGADYMGLYSDPWMNDVVNTSLADYDTGVNRSANAFRAQSIMGGGQAGGAQPVAAGVLAGEAARGRGSLAAGLRSQGFQFAAGQGQSDASRALQAGQGNQATQLARVSQQAALDQNTAQYNNDAKMQAIDMVTQNALASTNLGIQADDIQSRNAINAMVAAGTPLEQAIQIVQAQLGIYNAAVPGFGETGTSTGTDRLTGTSTGKNTGFNFGFSDKK